MTAAAPASAANASATDDVRLYTVSGNSGIDHVAGHQLDPSGRARRIRRRAVSASLEESLALTTRYGTGERRRCADRAAALIGVGLALGHRSQPGADDVLSSGTTSGATPLPQRGAVLEQQVDGRTQIGSEDVGERADELLFSSSDRRQQVDRDSTARAARRPRPRLPRAPQPTMACAASGRPVHS